jgi:hypothetical protein
MVLKCSPSCFVYCMSVMILVIYSTLRDLKGQQSPFFRSSSSNLWMPVYVTSLTCPLLQRYCNWRCWILGSRSAITKNTVSWDMTPYSRAQFYQILEQYTASIFRTEEWAKRSTTKSPASNRAVKYVLPKRRYISTRLHGITSCNWRRRCPGV